MGCCMRLLPSASCGLRRRFIACGASCGLRSFPQGSAGGLDHRTAMAGSVMVMIAAAAGRAASAAARVRSEERRVRERV